MAESVQVRFMSTVQSMAAYVQPYIGWIEQKLGTSYSNTLTLEKSTAPGDAAAEDLFAGASLVPVERKSESVRPGMTQRKTTYPS